MVFGKGGSERFGTLSGRERLPRLGEHLTWGRPHLLRNRGVPGEQVRVLLNRRGNALSTCSVWRLLDGYVKKAALNKKVSPHTPAAFLATHLWRAAPILPGGSGIAGARQRFTTQVCTRRSRKKIRECR